MKPLFDSVWQRRGVSWIWHDEALRQVTAAHDVLSLRQLMRHVGQWPQDLPSNEGRTMVVAGLDAGLDLLTPDDAEAWLTGDLKHAILSFQDCYQGDAALLFWLPGGERRLRVHAVSDAVSWRCAAPNGERQVEFGRLLWGVARQYPQEIMLARDAKPAGLFHLRIT